jgi:hypothetical protein
MLESFIQYMMSKEGVAFERVIDYVERWKQLNPLDSWNVSDPWGGRVESVGS